MKQASRNSLSTQNRKSIEGGRASSNTSPKAAAASQQPNSGKQKEGSQSSLPTFQRKMKSQSHMRSGTQAKISLQQSSSRGGQLNNDDLIIVDAKQIQEIKMNMEQEAKQDVIYRSFRNKEDEAIEKSSILLSKVFYLLDHKKVVYKLECDLEYFLSFLTKREESVKAETLGLLHRMCVNQDVATSLMREQNFHYLVELAQYSQSEDVRSTCFKIFGSLSSNSSKQAVKILFYQAKLIQIIVQRLRSEQSEDVLSSILLFIIKISSEDIYLELIISEMDLFAEVLQLLNYKKNLRVRRLSYNVLINLLCLDEMRKALLQQSKVDVMAKLISIIGKASREGSLVISEEDAINTLKALANSFQDTMLTVSFLQQKGHVALGSIFDVDSSQIKEICLAIYLRLALPRNDQQNANPLMTVAFDADLISDVLNLPLIDQRNVGLIRNMLMLLEVMLLNNTDKILPILQQFDIIKPLLHIISDSQEIGYMALGLMGMLAKHEHFKKLISQQNSSYISILEIINKAIHSLANEQPQRGEQILLFMRSLQVYLLSFDSIDGETLEIDQVISCVQAINEAYHNLENQTAKYYCILVLKRLSEMKNKQITEIIYCLEQYSQQVSDAPSITLSQQAGFINDILEKDISKYMTYYITEDLQNAGMNQTVIFYGNPIRAESIHIKQTEKLQKEVTVMKEKEDEMKREIAQLTTEKERLQNELKANAGIDFKAVQIPKSVQTDVSFNDEPQQTNTQASIPKLKEEILQNKRTIKDLESKNGNLQQRIIDLEQDLAIREKALSKFTQGVQLAEVIGSVKDKIRDDIKAQFDIFKSTIASLEGVIDTNSKLIKDLSSAVQERNIQNQALTCEDKVKQGKIQVLQNKCETLEKQINDIQLTQIQMRMHIEKLTFDLTKDLTRQPDAPPTLKIDLPQLQLSTEQVMISELRDKLTMLRVENLKLEDVTGRLEQQLKSSDSQCKDLQVEVEKLKSQVNLGTPSAYIIRSVKKDPNNLDETIAKVNEALAYIDKTLAKHNFKEELVNFYEEKLGKLSERYEHLLITHTQLMSHLHLCRSKILMSQLSTNTSLLDASSLQQNLEQGNNFLQWTQQTTHLKRMEDHAADLHRENKQLRLKLLDIEEQLTKYKKLVLFDHTQYEKLFKLKTEIPMSQAETTVLQYFSDNHERSEFLRLSKILDIVIKSCINLEYQVKMQTNEGMRNEYNLIVEQKEIELRKVLADRGQDYKIIKLEHRVQLMEDDMRVQEAMNKEGNPIMNNLNEVDDLLSKISFAIQPNSSYYPQNEILDNGDTQENFSRSNSNPRGQVNQQQMAVTSIGSQGNTQVKKKVQTTNLISVKDGKKPRIANDYNKKPKPVATGKIDLQQIEAFVRDAILKLSQARNDLAEDQKQKERQASDGLKEIEVLKQALHQRTIDNSELLNDIQRIINTKCELQNLLKFRDYQIQQSIVIMSAQPQLTQQGLLQETAQKLEGLLKVNNFTRKKELEAREECDLYKHKLEKQDKERLALSMENKKLTEQVKYLQNLLKRQREQLSKNNISTTDTTGQPTAEIPDDDIVKYLVQIDEMNQKIAELEYMLQLALQSNLDKDKLLRGTEDIVEGINVQLEQTVELIQNQMPAMLAKSSNPEQKKYVSTKMPAYRGPESVIERLQILNDCASKWKEQVQSQIQDLQKQREAIENLRPESQTLTQAEHQAKLEKYLNIYSARIQTLSSIIASYQRHFKSLEDQIRELSGVPNMQAQQLSMKQIESARIEALKRMINLKDILIKHQQNEIEYVQKAIIADKFNDLMIFVTPQEKEALKQMREFDLQMKVVQDFERQALLIKEEEEVQKKQGDEQMYLKLIHGKIEQDLIILREVFQTNHTAKQTNQVNSNASPRKVHPNDTTIKEIDFREFFERWLNTVRDLLQNPQFETEKCKNYIEALNQEIPIMISIISRASEQAYCQQSSDRNLDTTSSLEVGYLQKRIQELNQEKDDIDQQLIDYKDRCNFLRSKNQQLQEQNIMLKKFLHSKKHRIDEFKHIYKEDLINENSFLRQRILELTPYNEKLSIECAMLRRQTSELQNKLVRQQERHLEEQVLFQNLEQTLLDTQKKLIQKDGEALTLLKQNRDLLFKGSSDKALELLLQTADSLNTECLRLREQNWQLELSAKQVRSEIEQKTTKIKESKQVLKQYQQKIRELVTDKERLSILARANNCQNIFLNNVDSKSLTADVSKEKLIYELGGKDGGNAALKLLDAQAFYRTEQNRLIQEIQELKVKNTTLMLLAEDKNSKLLISQEELKKTRKQLREKEDEVERLDYQNQKLQDDFIVQQQSLDVYITLGLQSGKNAHQNAFNKCIENAQTLATLLQDTQRQRAFYYDKAITNEREAALLKEMLKVAGIQMKYYQDNNERSSCLIQHYEIQQSIANGVIGRYEKELGIINQLIQDNTAVSANQSTLLSLLDQYQLPQQYDNQVSPSKQQKNASAIESSPQYSNKKGQGICMRGPGQSSTKLPQGTTNRRGSSIHHLLISQLQLNELMADRIYLLKQLQTLKSENSLDSVLSNYFQTHNQELIAKNTSLQSEVIKYETANASLKMQNIYLSRWCLYSYRVNSFVFKREEYEPHMPDPDNDDVEKLMSMEIDKMRIDNKMLQDRNEHLEGKLRQARDLLNSVTTAEVDSNGAPLLKKGNNETTRENLLRKELAYQTQRVSEMEKELVSKTIQIEALSKIHNDFSQVKSLLQPAKSAVITTSLTAPSQSNQFYDPNSSNQPYETNNAALRQEYSKLEQTNLQLHEKLSMMEKRNSQRESKIEQLQQRIRQLEKQVIANNCGNIQEEKQDEPGSAIKGNNQSEKEAILQAELDEVWKKFTELNQLKNSLIERNEDLQVEIDSFKTHFSKYEAQEFKKRIAQSNDAQTFQNALYNELTSLREERDLLLWQVNKLFQKLITQQTKMDALKETTIPDLEKQVQSFQTRELVLNSEIGQLKEQLLIATSSDFDKARTLFQIHELTHLRKEKITLTYENNRVRRECEALRKEMLGRKQQQENVLKREYQLKKQLVELKNELVKIKVNQDMGDYHTMVTGSSPTKSAFGSAIKSSKKLTGDEQEGIQSNAEKVKMYVEDLTVMRESLLKIEFRNIELEELHAKKDRECDDLKMQIRDLQNNLIGSNGGNKNISLELDPQMIQQVDLQQQLLQERWNSKKLQSILDEQEPLMKELLATQERYFEEVKEHHRVQTEISLVTIIYKCSLLEFLNLLLEDSILGFYDSMRERYINHLNLYIDEMRYLKRQILRTEEENRSIKDCNVSLTIKCSGFEKERQSYKQLIDQIANQKLQQIEDDFFVNSAQHEEGLSKLEVHILNQRKKLSQQKSELDILKNEKELLYQNLTAQIDIAHNLEKQTFAYNAELTEAREEFGKLRGQIQTYECNLQWLWQRCDFQERSHHLIMVDNATVEQVVKLYKEEIAKIKKHHLRSGSQKYETLTNFSKKQEDCNDKSGQIGQEKKTNFEIESELSRLRQKERVLEDQLLKKRNQLDEIKLHSRLAEMLRKTVGVSQQERDNFELKMLQKREKINKLKAALDKEFEEKSRLIERVEFLERQFAMNTGVTVGSGGAVYVKATENEDNSIFDQDGNKLDPREIYRQNQLMKIQVHELDQTNVALKQQIQELTMSLKYYEDSNKSISSTAGGVEKQEKVKTSQSNRLRAVTPVRIREMPIKPLQSQRKPKQQIQPNDQTALAFEETQRTNDFYYGSGVNTDHQNYQQEDQSFIDRQSLASKTSQRNTKLPKIGAGANYIQPDSQMRLNPNMVIGGIERRNMTPLPIRNDGTAYSNLSAGSDQFHQYQQQQPIRAIGGSNYQQQLSTIQVPASDHHPYRIHNSQTTLRGQEPGGQFETITPPQMRTIQMNSSEYGNNQELPSESQYLQSSNQSSYQQQQQIMMSTFQKESSQSGASTNNQFMFRN